MDDELMRELHARVFREEEGHPKACIPRTLGVLRYLARDVAVAFGKLQKVAMDDSRVPTDDASPGHVLRAIGLSHATMLVLDDAGLSS